jgi:hypothetical protein
MLLSPPAQPCSCSEPSVCGSDGGRDLGCSHTMLLLLEWPKQDGLQDDDIHMQQVDKAKLMGYTLLKVRKFCGTYSSQRVHLESIISLLTTDYRFEVVLQLPIDLGVIDRIGCIINIQYVTNKFRSMPRHF